jgi:cysteine desulfurase
VRIYLDHNATTPLRDEVVDAVSRALRDAYGNPSSTHAEGARARAEIDRARERVAALLGASPDEIVFTAGATEANNAAIAAAIARGAAAGRRHVVTSRVEHPSVAEPLRRLESQGAAVVTWLPTDADGLVDPEEVARAVRDDTALVTLIWANNETGVLLPVEEIAARVAGRGALLHLDATQRVGKLPIDLGRLPADLLAASAHKLNGPKGAGCLFVRRGLAFEPLLAGGAQERRRRGGTENTPAIAGFGVACDLARAELAESAARNAALRDRLWQGIAAKVPRVRRNGSAEHVLPNTLSVEFEGAPGDVLLEALDLEDVAVSSGAACHSGSIEPSAVLLAMGRTPAQARGSLRFSVGHGVDEAQVDAVLARLPDLVARAREAA